AEPVTEPATRPAGSASSKAETTAAPQQIASTATRVDSAESPATNTPPAQSDNTPQAINLQQQLALTEQWIDNANSEHFTIQLSLIDAWATEKVNQYLQRAAETLQPDKLFIYPASIQGRMVYSVLYNDYAGREAATEQLRQLAPWIRQNAPYLRTVTGIKADIRKTEQQTAHQPDEATP
ncbi:MAG TPA: hypothetical protein VIQ81_01240, partial [Gammaproteobacteria bacterium]